VLGASRGAAVVVVKACEYRDAADGADELRWSRNGLLLCESLVRTSFVVEPDELYDEAAEMVLGEDEGVVEELTSQCADEPFGEGVRVRRVDRRSHDSGADPREGADESGAELPISVADKGSAEPCGRTSRCAPAVRTRRLSARR
jgi:hypothetical protein